VSPTTSTNKNYYQISGPGSYSIQSASSTSNLAVVTLTLSSLTPLQTNSVFVLFATTNIIDLATPPNHLPPGSGTTFMTGS
jgi:hypothetical protein